MSNKKKSNMFKQKLLRCKKIKKSLDLFNTHWAKFSSQLTLL